MFNIMEELVRIDQAFAEYLIRIYTCWKKNRDPSSERCEKCRHRLMCETIDTIYMYILLNHNKELSKK